MKDKNDEIDSIDLDKFAIDSIKVAVDGKALPLKIGSKICIEHEEEIVRTVISIKIDIHGNASYCLEWFDGCNCKYEWMSLNEMCYMRANLKKRNPISLDQQAEG